MSHDPKSLDYEIKITKRTFNAIRYTHGMQFGIEIWVILWSLAQYAYAQWAGLYENLGRYVYVNRGFDLRLPR
jgi:hypothetical protein